MAENFTHTFEIRLVNNHVIGECKFTPEGKAVLSLGDSSESIPIDMLGWVHEFMVFMEELYHIENPNGIINISIIKKE